MEFTPDSILEKRKELFNPTLFAGQINEALHAESDHTSRWKLGDVRLRGQNIIEQMQENNIHIKEISPQERPPLYTAPRIGKIKEDNKSYFVFFNKETEEFFRIEEAGAKYEKYR